ncbi:MAG: YwaF family protein [Clostridia bacterium]|nr:YwaF family protein [Clostridia bacterium]
MRDFLVKLLSTKEGAAEITVFSIWHILYILIIVGGSILAAYLTYKKSDEIKNKIMTVVSILVPATYALDFFIMPLSESSQTIDTDKLPFHICTLMGILIPFVCFNKHFEKIKNPVTCLVMVASLMYITYPGSAVGDVTPWCYKVVQTFTYHGLMFLWAMLMLSYGKSKLETRKIWKELVIIVCIIIWAGTANLIYSSEEHHYDWFFVTGSTFPFVPAPLMPFTVLAAVGGMCAIIHGLYHLWNKKIRKH